MRAFENHSHWSAVKDVCRQLKDAGFRALLAGGCVRDLLMEREPHDFDIATDATPDQVEALFPKALMVGKAFGVTILPFEGFQLEIATFREDLEYKDGRRPEGVKFSSPEADAQRRDFTVNALFLDPETDEVLDFVGGRRDLEAKIIRTVGDPERRFEEDKLRLLRTVRFAAQLKFQIDGPTLEAVIRKAPEVAVVSRERVRDELVKLLKAPARVIGLELLLSTGLLSAAVAQSAPFILGDETEWLRRFEVIDGEPAASFRGMEVLLALFFAPVYAHTGEKDFKERHLKDLRLDNHQVKAVTFLLKHLPDMREPQELRFGELLHCLSQPDGEALLEFAEIFERASEPSSSDRRRTEERQAVLSRARTSLGPGLKAPAPFLTGADLKAQGISAGPQMGELLREAFLLQLEGALASREAAQEWLARQRSH